MYIYKKYFLLLGFILASSFVVVSQILVEEFPVFNVGEKISYEASYNWGFIWLNAGKVEFTVDEINYNDKNAYNFNAYGASVPLYDWLFKVRDNFYSYVTKDSFTSLYFNRNTLEGGFYVKNSYSFNYKDSLIYSQTENTDKPLTLDTLVLEQKIFDVISGVYYIRNFDFEKYKLNDTIPIKMIIDNEIFDLYIRYLGKEIIKTHHKRKFKTIKFSALLIEGTIFKGGEDLFIWVSDDLNRIPVLVEAKILIGSVKATITNTENLKFPLSSEIENN